MARSLGTFVSSLFPVLPVALVAWSVGCGSTVVGGGEVGEDGPGCASVVLADGSVVKSPLCDVAEEVNEDGSSDGEDGASDGSSDGEDGDEEPGSGAIVYRLPGDGSGSSGTGESTSSQVGGGETEERIVIRIANHDAATCAEPYATPECPFEALEISVSVPADRFAPGEVISLGDPDVFVSFSEQGVNDGTDSCWGTGSGGGSGEPGTLTIEAHGQGTIDVTFSGTAHALLEGSHTAPFCE